VQVACEYCGTASKPANTCFELIPEGKCPIRSLSIASDASILVAANNRGSVFIWRLGSKGVLEPLHKLEAHSTYILKCLLSPDVKFLATASADKTIKIWSVDRGFALDKTLSGHQAWVWDCSFSADSAYLVSASSDKTSKLWDVKTGEIIVEYRDVHDKAVTAVALNDSSA